MKLTIVLPQNRAYSGYFVALSVEGKLLTHGRALGKADNGKAAEKGNPKRDPRKEYGDTPTGEYWHAKAVLYAGVSEDYGKGHIELEGKSGDALAAMEGGRTGLLIHAGREVKNGRLVPTYGCIRVSPQGFDDIVREAGGGYIDITILEETV